MSPRTLGAYLDRYQLLTPAQLAEQVNEMLLVRAGQPLTPELAMERARNIAAAFACTVITGGDGKP